MSERKDRLDATAIVCLLLCCAVWGVNQVAAKAALAELPPLLQAGARSAGAALLVALWSRQRGVSLGVGDGTLVAGVVAGTMFALEFGCIYAGLRLTTASRMVVFVYLAPFIVALGMPLVARSERLRAGQLAGLALAFAGVAWAYAEGLGPRARGDQQWLGDALGVAGALLWGGTTLAVRASALATAAPEKTLYYQLAVSAVLLLGASAVTGEPWPVALHGATIALMAFQIVVVCFASYLLWFWLVRHYPATRISAFTLATPLLGLVAGAVLLGEALTPRLVTAGAAVALGIALVNRAPR
jgi:drug/metabolite transporter (DMT)-like permease